MREARSENVAAVAIPIGMREANSQIARVESTLSDLLRDSRKRPSKKHEPSLELDFVVSIT